MRVTLLKVDFTPCDIYVFYDFYVKYYLVTSFAFTLMPTFS